MISGIPLILDLGNSCVYVVFWSPVNGWWPGEAVQSRGVWHDLSNTFEGYFDSFVI